MPEISRFLGIVIAMYYNDHAPAHFHAQYGSHAVRVEIASCTVLSGSIPPRALRLVLEWLDLHRDQLAADWRLAGQRRPLNRIDPLE